jgi:hypothetical protein
MWNYLLSGRIVLMLLPVMAVVALMVRRTSGAADGEFWRQWLFCLVLLVLPFAASSLRGDRPPDRVFVNVAPMFALFVAFSARIVGASLPARRMWGVGALLAAAVYCYVMFAVSLRGMDARLRTDIQEGRKSQDAFYAYYQGCYAPYRMTAKLVAEFSTEPGPIFVYDYGDKAALYRYLEKTHLPCFQIGEPSEIDVSAAGVAYVVTAWPRRCQRRILQTCPGMRCELLTDEAAFQGVLVCRRGGAGTGAASQAAPTSSIGK